MLLQRFLMVALCMLAFAAVVLCEGEGDATTPANGALMAFDSMAVALMLIISTGLALFATSATSSVLGGKL